MRCILSIFLVALVISFGSPLTYADPGIPDTVKIEGGPLIIGQSAPLTLSVYNDEGVSGYSFGLITEELAGGTARYDSVVYVGRMSDPSVLDWRIDVVRDGDGIPPDSLHLGAGYWTGNKLPVGGGPILELYFTGLTTGTMTIDSCFIPPGGRFMLVAADFSAEAILPQFAASPIEVIEAAFPPLIDVPGEVSPVSAGTDVDFSVSATSPEGFPVEINLISLKGYDDDSRLPANPPSFSQGNPAGFLWTTTGADAGVWEAAFTATDTAGQTTDGNVTLQVLESESFIVPFSLQAESGITRSISLIHGNFDGDGNPEIFTTALINPTCELYDYQGFGDWTRVFGNVDNRHRSGPRVGYLDSDDNLDIIMMAWDEYFSRAYVFLGDGNNAFTEVGGGNDGFPSRGSALGEFTGDNLLDFVSVNQTWAKIYSGTVPTEFLLFETIGTDDSALSVNVADFNVDGYDDLAVGTVSGIKIYLNDGAGNFTLANFYAQTYGSLDVQVTNEGSDFNGDGMFDLCISTPSVGGARSQMVVYIGAGDGSFTQTVIRDIRGQIFGNRVGDFNDDGDLDIAYANGTLGYIAILFGDGSGTAFENELRITIPYYNPQHLDCFDVDLDGDLDIVAAAVGTQYDDNTLVTLLNEINPSGLSSCAFNISACNNAEMELTSPAGKVLNRMKSSMSAGEFFRRNLDSNEKIDNFASVKVVESGKYMLSTAPRPNATPEETFTVEFMLDGEQYRLAKDIPMKPEGYDFAVYPGEDTDVMPRPGKFVQINPPTFAWNGEQAHDFQLAADIEFTDVLASATVEGGTYSPPVPVPVSEGSVCYWRIKPHDAPEFGDIYAVNITATPTMCGDVNGDGIVNVGDAVSLIVYIFKQGPAPEPLEAGDVNGDGTINVGDVVYMIRFIFLGGALPICP